MDYSQFDHISDEELDKIISNSQPKTDYSEFNNISDEELDRIIASKQPASKPAVNQAAPKQTTTNINNPTPQPTKTLTGGVSVNVTNPNKSQSTWRNAGRQFARGTARALAPEKLENWAVGSKNDEALLNQYIKSGVPTYEQINKDYRTGKIDKAQLKVLVNKRKHFDDLMADAEYRAVRNKNIGKGTLEVGSAAIGGGAGTAAAKVGIQAIKQGSKQLAKQALKEVGKTFAIGTGYGAAEGVIDENINPATNALKQGAIWGATHAATLGAGKGIQAAAPAVNKAVKAVANTKPVKAVGKAVSDAKAKVDDKVFDTITSTEAGTKALQTVENAKNKLNQGLTKIGQELTKERESVVDKAVRTFKQHKQAKANATPAVEETIAQNVDEVAPSQYGVPEDNSAINQQLADRMNNDVVAEQELLNEYNQKVATAKEQYGSVENLKAQAVKDMEKEQWGEVTQPLKDYRELVEYEKTLGQAKYVNPNSKSVVNGEYSGNVANAVSGKKTFKQARAKKVNKDQSKLVEPNPQAEPFNPSMLEEAGSPVVVQRGINTPKTNLTHVNEAPTSSNIVGSRTKESALAQNADKTNEVSNAIKNKPVMYEAITNAETTAQAQKEVAENIGEVQADVIKKLTDDNAEVTALDVEKTRQVFSELQNQGRLEEAVDLLALASKQGSKLGQAVQAFSLWSKTTPEGAQLYAQRLLDKYNKNTRKELQKHLSKKELAEIGEAFKKLNESGLTGRELELATARAMKKVYKVVPKTFGQKLEGYRYINMLLSGKSRIKDFILTGKNAFDIAVDETIAGGIDKLRSALTKDKTRYVSANPFAGMKDWFKGFKKGAKEGAEDVRYDVATGRSGEVGRYGLPNQSVFEIPEFEGSILKRALTVAKYPAGSAEKLLRYTLQVPDRAFFEARFASSLANQMKARGLAEPTQDMINSAFKEAKRAVFQENRAITKGSEEVLKQLDNVTVRNLEKALGLPPNSLPSASKSIAAFVKTPTNVAAQGLEGLHGSISGTGQLMNAIRQGSPEAIREAELLMGRGIRGLGELGLGTAVGKGAWDSIKHNIGEDYTENEVTGLKPKSVIIGDKAFTMENMQTNLPFFAGVGLGQNGIGQAYTNVSDIVKEMPGFKAINDVVKLGKELDDTAKSNNVKVNGTKKALKMGRNLAASYLTSMVPMGGELGEWRNIVDPNARVVNDPDHLKYFSNRVLNRLPFASRLLPKKRNKIGKDVMVNNIKNPAARMVSEMVDFGVRNYNKPSIEYETLKAQNLLPKKAPNYIDIKVPTKDKKKKYEKRRKHFTAEEYSKYQQLLGAMEYESRRGREAIYGPLDEEKTEKLKNKIKTTDSDIRAYINWKEFGGMKPDISRKRFELVEQLYEQAKRKE